MSTTVFALMMSIIVVIGGFGTLVFFLAREIHKAHDARFQALQSGAALLKSNFELQAQVREWKDAHEHATAALSDKNAELERAVAARKVLEHRHSDLVLRMTEGAPLDDLTQELQADLDKVRALSLPPPTPLEHLPPPLPAPPKERDTPVERPITGPKTGGGK